MEGVENLSPDAWIAVGVAIVLVGGGLWRWNVVNRPALTDARCKELSALVVEDLFEYASEAGEIVRLNAAYWRQVELTDSEWIYLCRWMNTRGVISTPNDWGWIAIILGNPPTGLALTQKSWGLTMDHRRQSNISIGNVQGPVNIGGQQIVISGQSLSSDDLRGLVAALRDDAHRLPEPDASSALAAAESLQGVADGRMPNTSPAAAGALAWVRQRASESVGSAGGAALWAGTVAVAKILGWVS